MQQVGFGIGILEKIGVIKVKYGACSGPVYFLTDLDPGGQIIMGPGSYLAVW